MTITLELTPDEEARLRAQAARQGQAPEEVAHGLVRDGLGGTAPSAISPEELLARPTTPEEREAQRRLAERLLAQGAIPFIPPGRSGPPPRLIAVRGEPVSETIIKERR